MEDWSSTLASVAVRPVLVGSFGMAPGGGFTVHSIMEGGLRIDRMNGGCMSIKQVPTTCSEMTSRQPSDSEPWHSLCMAIRSVQRFLARVRRPHLHIHYSFPFRSDRMTTARTNSVPVSRGRFVEKKARAVVGTPWNSYSRDDPTFAGLGAHSSSVNRSFPRTVKLVKHLHQCSFPQPCLRPSCISSRTSPLPPVPLAAAGDMRSAA